MKIMKKLLSATIASITLLSSATSIGTFSASAANTRYKTTNTMGLEFEIENNYAVLKKCTSSASVITVPQTIYYKSGNNNWTLPVKKIDSNAFLNKKSLYEINLPKGLQIIESNAFYGCSNLRKAIIPYTVTSCKKSAFTKCTNMKYIFTDSLSSSSYADTTNLPYCKNLRQNIEYKMGNMNNDVYVDIADAQLILNLYTSKTLIGIAPTINELAKADVNRDGSVTVEDAMIVNNFYTINLSSGGKGYAYQFVAYSASYSKHLPYNVDSYKVVRMN